MEYYTFEQLKEMAFKDGITGNKVAVGIWAKMNGFLKKKKQINKRRITFYFKLDDWQPHNVCLSKPFYKAASRTAYNTCSGIHSQPDNTRK